MFKNIQKELLLKNPLLWNLKIIPFAAFALLLHVIFFILGYLNGAIDFKEIRNFNSFMDDSLVVFVSVLITILIFIIWLVLYSRNNAFKSFYPKKNASLWKEWLLIAAFCVLNVNYSTTYFFAKDLRATSYYTEEEAYKRFEVISMASLFLEGGYLENGVEWVPKNDGTEAKVQIQRDSFSFNGRQYHLKSLLNKDVYKFRVFSDQQDSLNKLKVKRWLIANQKDSIQKLLDSYFKIHEEHNLPSNIDAKKWMDLVYDYPEFTKYTVIGKEIRDGVAGGYYNDDIYNETMAYEEAYEQAFDSTSQYVKVINGREYVYYKHYVSQYQLINGYDKISQAMEQPTVDQSFLQVMAYLSLGMSLLFFSFKVTSGRNWLIAFVSIGVTGIVLGIFTAITGAGLAFPIMVVFIFVLLLIYFIVVLRSGKGKQISGITLNQLLWLLPSILPIIYLVTLDIIKDVSGYNDRYGLYGRKLPVEEFPRIEWMDNFTSTFMWLNVLLLLLWMYCFSICIKKWKGIAEG